MAKKEEKSRIPVMPGACFYYDEEKYVETKLPEAAKEKINFEVDCFSDFQQPFK